MGGADKVCTEEKRGFGCDREVWGERRCVRGGWEQDAAEAEAGRRPTNTGGSGGGRLLLGLPEVGRVGSGWEQDATEGEAGWRRWRRRQGGSRRTWADPGGAGGCGRLQLLSRLPPASCKRLGQDATSPGLPGEPEADG
ncbi:hypothetical protein PR202_gb04931 [Eleusine coracana subsp. coracana]|uniref:Uncharacterized protein n=1 Tax=Eleusine coracana subsp. coracana TaxID=191504 RepID=A0AAV5E5R7_ELECO|nr:hypothetical protein PR202_gb04931 [Eleusine coracana subsp. coracana]